jgi:hypothetical protein
MKPAPVFAPWPKPLAPNARYWSTAGAVLLGVGSATYAAEPGTLAFLLAALALFMLAWLLRLLYWRAGVHNAERYRLETDRVQAVWWAEHRRHIALQESVLLGPTCVTPAQCQALMSGNLRPPAPRLAEGGPALRLARTFHGDIGAREAALACLLALQWCEQREGRLPAPAASYWVGSSGAWQAFREQAMNCFPGLTLPEAPERWGGAEAMPALIERLRSGPPGAVFLCAGCCVMPATAASERPAGEAAVLWLLGCEGGAQLTCGEYFQAERDTDVLALAARAQQQSELSLPPDVSFIFSQPGFPGLDNIGWNTRQHIQDGYWGNIGHLQAMVAQTLAARYAQTHATACGWVACDIIHTLALGIIKPDGKGQ